MYLAEILALCAAICIAMSSMLVSELRGRLPLLDLARLQMGTAFFMTAAVSLAVGGWRTIGLWQLGFLAVSSLFGIIIASTTYFAAIYTAGPRTTALLFSLTAPFAVLFGYLFLGETIDGQQGAGIACVLLGILLAIGARGTAKSKGTERISWLGIVLGVVTALGQALGSLAARPAMAAGAEPFTAMAVRSGIAALFFLLLMAVPHPVVKPAAQIGKRSLSLAVGSAFFGVGLGMSLLMAALAHGSVGIVSTLSSMTPVVILPMIWARTGAVPPPLAWLGAALAVAGTALISL
ncbi:DMT family transporter [Shinella sp. 838]|jgi:drug/metabolite transporter (DMT)-like permease|uniref:DMT family transporter n=1 Tax=unclassified Shinella TaxID=2643062 RepID=UPI0003C55D51|nr:MULTISPECIES: DMT family transporter [unclassified Shinella]EYR77377.1 EamA-like transporter family [Shinella sp. DD12]MCA0344829.1 DMT family transporter [Pseudomonadota bacterium]MDG4672419.1 DMT family transporter [Shinella sp. 838]